MATLSLKVGVVGTNGTKTMQFEPTCIVYDACRIIREKIPEASTGNPPRTPPVTLAVSSEASDFGLFLADEDSKKGVWLESGRTLEYYLLRNGDLLEYKSKFRRLRVRMLDGSVKTLQVDDSHTIAQLMVTACSKIGISNHEEFSLVKELTDEEKEKTMTLKRERTLARDQKKLEEMKKKLHTDDELNWLDHAKTLREQGIDENETLLLRRKFFFSDQNVDARDPVQLNLLYVQSRDAILNGTHPVTMEEAVLFGGIQCQVQFGDHVEHKHKTGFLDLKEFLPKEYIKVKGIEKKIFLEHRKLIGLTEIAAKHRYTSHCRSLKTYGITFFLVKEKMKGKNKLVPRLLGITKESVVRVDEKTKQILKTWPLTTVRRWAASPNSFTLDFGDYAENYYSVQTTEGEQISQLIAGYIDIILKKKKAKDHFGIEGDEESTMLEDSVSPAKATIIQHQSSNAGQAQTGSVAMPAILRAGDQGNAQFSTGSMQQAQFTQVSNQAHSAHFPPSGKSPQVHGLGQAQRALVGTITIGLDDIDNARNDLNTKADLPPLGNDAAAKKWKENTLDVSRQNINSQLSAMNAGTAQLVTLTAGGPDDTDFTAVGSAVQNITTNITEMSRDIRMLAALQDSDDDGDRLLGAAKKLVDAFATMLKAAQPDSKESRQNLLSSASKVGELAGDLMREAMIYETTEDMDKAFQDTLLGLAKAVANATAALVLKAKGVAGKVEDQAQQNKVISSATQCALATSQLVACTKVVAPTVSSPACAEQLVEAAKLVAKSVEGVVQTAQGACSDDKVLSELGGAATAVTRALNDLLQHVKQGATKGIQADATVDTILTATDRLFSSMGDAPEMVKQARVLAQATSQLVNAIKGQAETHPDQEMQKRLLAAAKQLADATTKLVEAAKGCASNPNDPAMQQVLKEAAEDVRSVTNTAAANALKKRLIANLENAAKLTASASTQLISSASGASKTNRNASSQQQLVTSCKTVSELIPALVHSIKATSNSPEDAAVQLALINACQDILQPSNKLIASAKAAAPTVGDQATALSLTNSTKNLSAALAELRTACSKAQEACGSLELDGALGQIEELEKELDEILASADSKNLLPLPGETAESCALQVGATSKTVGSSMAQLLTAATQGNENYTGIAARDTANNLRVLTNAVRGVAACSGNPDVQHAIVESTQEIMIKSALLIEEAKNAVADPSNPDNNQRLAQVAKAVSNALNNCVNCLPGQRDVDNAIKQISTYSQEINNISLSGNYPPTNKTFQEVQLQLNNSAVNLNQGACEIVTHSRGTPQQLASSSNRFSKSYGEFVHSGLTMAGITKDTEVKSSIVTNLKSTSMVSSKLLLAAKSLHADPNAPNAKNLLAQAARAVTESINHLINICTTSAPGQKDCDNALRQIQMMKNLLDNPNEAVSDGSYFDCLDGVIARSKALGDAMTGIADHAKKGALDEFCVSVKNFAAAVCGLTENASQAAYLVAIADPASEPGRPGLVDQSQFARANQAIQMACQSLTNPASSQQEVLSAATVVAKHTSALCNTCRTASSKTSNPVAKRHFVQSAKDVANSTANLVRAIKDLDSNFSDENRQKCAAASRPLIQAVDELTTFASSPEFASIPAKISHEARKAQEPITNSGRAMLDGACNMVQAAKQLAINPKDPPTYLLYSNHSKSVSDAIKKLVSSIKDAAPGQKECEEAIEKINSTIKELDQSSLAAISQNLTPRNDNTLQGFQEQMIGSAREIMENIDSIQSAAKSEAENLGHCVTTFSSYFEPLSRGAIGTASKTMNSKRQMEILDQTKTVSESAMQFMYAAKEGAGNPKTFQAVHTHNAIDEGAEGMKDVLKDLLETLEEVVSQAGNVTSMITGITKNISKVDEPMAPNENISFVDYQTNMVRLAKQIAHSSQDMVVRAGMNMPAGLSKSPQSAGDLGTLANNVTRDYSNLVHDSRGAVGATANPEVGNRIKLSVQELGNASIDLVRDAGNLQANPTDSFAKKDLTDHARTVAEKVSYVLAALQAGSRGTQACINAASTVSGIIGDLDTTIMFATAGTLNAETDENVFSDHRESILKTAKALVEDTKTLVAGAASNQEQLAIAAQSAVKTITNLSEVVKRGAAALGSDQPDAQVLLINAVKDVASALGDLISATKNASGKTVHDPAMTNLKDSAKVNDVVKVMVTNVTSLLKTVKTVEDEAARGTRALESTIEAISQELRAYEATDRTEVKATAEDLIRATKPVTMATGKTVAAGNSGRQEDVIAASNIGRKAMFDLLHVCKATAMTAETKEIRIKTINSGRDCCVAYRELMEMLNITIQKPSQENRQKMAVISKRVATSVTEIVQSAEMIKETEDDESKQHLPSPLNICGVQANMLRSERFGSRSPISPKDCNGPCYSEWMFKRYANQDQAAKAGGHFTTTYHHTVKSSDWVDPDDPMVTAENELLGAANSIEAAAKKLAMLKPRQKAREADDTLEFEDQILDAAKSIAAATAALVKCASSAQRELVLQGKIKPSYHRDRIDDDGQWSQGLISAARIVAAATHSLCEAANAMMQGHASEEKLISSAKQVASSTAQLLVACKVKADSDSVAMKRLQSAGNAVKRATDALVNAAQQAKDNMDEANILTVNKRMVGGMAQIISAQEEILRKEKELEMARKKLVTIRQGRYNKQSSTDENGGSSAF
ncbi:talin-1-like isoform X4 [Lineus longissimus]|uniref:talin-1-like isoform X4 n=1 Tax=Lineus longissimus TaxID=88925 RepID=UPI00315CB57D